MKKTTRLYGVNPEKYAELQVALCELKMQDAKSLLKELRPSLDLLDSSAEQKELQIRIEDVKDAVKFNEELIDEATGKI